MDTAGGNRKWSLRKEKRTLCNVIILVVGFALMIVYTKVTVKREISIMAQHSRTIRSLRKRQANIRSEDRNGDSESQFIAAHLTARRGENVLYHGEFQSPQRGDCFRWTSEGSNAFATVDVAEEPEGTMIYIQTTGFYFVYSQIRYNGFGLYPAGHKTVKISRQLMERTLMTSMTTQQLAPAGNRRGEATRTTDSGYQAGVFFLHAGDKIAVKPIIYQSNRLYTVGDDASFFGLYFLHE